MRPVGRWGEEYSELWDIRDKEQENDKINKQGTGTIRHRSRETVELGRATGELDGDHCGLGFSQWACS